MRKVTSLLCLFFSLFFGINAQSLSENDCFLDLKFKRKGVFIFLRNQGSDTLCMSSFMVDQQSIHKYEARSYTQKGDTLVVNLFGGKEISFAHEFKGDWKIDGESREKEILILPFQEVYIKLKRTNFTKKDVSHIILKVKGNGIYFDV